jgi:hypothetical protein
LAAALAGGRLLVGAHQREVERDIIVVRIVDEGIEHLFPDPGLGPAGEALMQGLPLAVTLRQVMPVRAGSQHPQDAVHEGQIVLRRASGIARLARHQLFDPSPLDRGEFVTLWLGHHRPKSENLEPHESHNSAKLSLECRLVLEPDLTKRSLNNKAHP